MGSERDETRGRKKGYKRDPEVTARIWQTRREKALGYANVPTPVNEETSLEVRASVAERDGNKCVTCHAEHLKTSKTGKVSVNHKEKVMVHTLHTGDPEGKDDNVLLCKWCRQQPSTTYARTMEQLIDGL